MFSFNYASARSGCCSHHGGVCGCGCCDGTSLSSTCAPYYPECGSGYSAPSYSLYTTIKCPSNSYESLGSCKCNSGYIVQSGSCVSVGSYCSGLDYNSEYDSISGSCKCKSGYLNKNNKCISQSSYCSEIDSNSKWDSSKSSCVCKTGYVFSNSKCISDEKSNYDLSYDLLANYNNTQCPTNSTLNSVDSKCYCNDGYVLRNNNCISYTDDCKLSFGNNVYGTKGTSNNNSYCYCNDGYKWNDDKTNCIENITCPVNSILFGGECKCLDDLELNSDKTACVKKSVQVSIVSDCQIGYKLDAVSNKCIIDVNYVLEQKAKSKGKEKISGPSKMKLYKNIEKIGNNLWGNKK